VAVSLLYALPTYFSAPRKRSSWIEPYQGFNSLQGVCFAILLQGRTSMLDIILIAAGLGFFALSVAYAYGCDRL
jgi:hypothetical protein